MLTRTTANGARARDGRDVSRERASTGRVDRPSTGSKGEAAAREQLPQCRSCRSNGLQRSCKSDAEPYPSRATSIAQLQTPGQARAETPPAPFL